MRLAFFRQLGIPDLRHGGIFVTLCTYALNARQLFGG